MSRFWLYLGIILVCSGVGTGVGILLVIFYFWDDIKKSLNNFDLTGDNFSEKNCDPKYYNEDTMEEMK